jgi:hypothetical protein
LLREVDLRHRPAAKPPKHCEVFQFSPNQVGHGEAPQLKELVSRLRNNLDAELMKMLVECSSHLYLKVVD